MATANPSSPPARSSRWLRRAFMAGLFALALGIALYWTPLRQTALTGAALGARVACSCHFVAGRPLGECRRDFEPGMALVMLSSDEDAQSVTARFPLLASQTAVYRAGTGCVLERWAD